MKHIQAQTGRRSEEGSTLMMAVIPMIILSVAMVASLQLATSRTKMAVRSQAWNISLAMSEAGIEEAMAHLNYTQGANLARFGWAFNGTTYSKSNNLGAGSYIVHITTNTSPEVGAQGFAKLPAAALLAAVGGQTAPVEQKVKRTVYVTTKRVPPVIGLVAKGKVTIQNEFDADSYHSGDPAHSGPGGVYDPAKANANSFIGTISTINQDMLVKDNSQIRGSVGSGSAGVISLSGAASVGDAGWVTSHPGAIQSGCQQNDCAAVITDIPLPFTTSQTPQSGGGATWLLSGGNYRIGGTLTMDGSKTMLVTGNSRLYVTDSIYVKGSASIQIQPGASLELYVAQQVYVQESGKINHLGTPDRFLLVGLSDTSFYIQGNAIVSGVLHAPKAKFYLQDNAHLCGAGVFNEIVCQNQADYHYDEALSTSKEGIFQITSWTEK